MHKNKINFSVIIISVILLFLVGTGIASWIITISKTFKPEYLQTGEVISSIDASPVVYDGNYHMPLILNEEIINDSKYVIKYSTSDNPDWFVNIQFDSEGLPSSGPMNAGTYSFKYENVNNKNDYVIVPFEIVKADVKIINVPTSLSTRYGEQINIASSNTYAVHKTISTLKVTGNFVLTDTLLEASGTADSITTKTSIKFIPTGDDANNYNTAIINEVTVSLDPVAYSGSTYYSSVEYALESVKSGNIYVIPGKNPTVYRDCTVVKGVTLNLPYSGTNIGGHDVDQMNSTGTESYARNNPSAYLKSEVTLSEGLALTVNGTLTIGGILTGGQLTAGHTCNNYAQITMKASSQIICNNTINCYGYIIGEYGDEETIVTIKNGATLKMPFIVQEHRGGSIFRAMAHLEGLLDFEPKLKTSPFNRFHFNNIESLVIYEYGGVLIGMADLYASRMHNETQVKMIGPYDSSGTNKYLLSSYEGTVIKSRYVHSTQINKIDVYGGLSLLPLEIIVSGITISTAKILMPISWYYDLSFNKYESGSNSSIDFTQQSIRLLPGAKLTINEGVSVNGNILSIFESIPQYLSGDSGLKYPTVYPTGDIQGQTIPGAYFELNGTLIINELGGIVNTKKEGAKLVVNTSTAVQTHELINYVDPDPIYEKHEEYLKAYLYTSDGIQDIPSSIGKGTYFSKEYSNTEECGWIADPIKLTYIIYLGQDEKVLKENISITNNGEITGYPIKQSDLDLLPTISEGYRAHYKFLYWSVSPDEYINPLNYSAYANTIIYGVWEPIKYDISYIMNKYVGENTNGIVNNDEINFDISNNSDYWKTYTVTDNYTLPTPYLANYDFAGWYTDEACTTRIYTIRENTFNGKITLYALWYQEGATKYTVNVNIIDENGNNYPGETYNFNEIVVYSFTDGNTSISINEYLDIINSVNSNIDTIDYYFSKIYLNSEALSNNEIVLNKSNNTGSAITLDIYIRDKVTINYHIGDSISYQYLIPSDEEDIPNTSIKQYTTKQYYSPYTLWFTKESPSGETYYIANQTAISLQEDIQLYGYQYVNVSISYSYSNVTITTTINKSIILNNNLQATSSSTPATGKTSNYVLAVGASIEFGVTAASGYENATVTPTTSIITNENNQTISVSGTAEEKSGGGPCFSSDTLVKTNNGDKFIYQVVENDLILSYNHITGQYEYVKIAALIYHGNTCYEVIKLKFSDGTYIEFINNHGLFDLTLNRYVDFTIDNYKSYINHDFIKYENGKNIAVKLIDVEIITKETGSYTLVSQGNLNCIGNGLLNITSVLYGIYNIFDYDENQNFNLEQMNNDLEKYGIYTYNDFENIISYKIFIDYGFKYFKVSIGKGLMTFDTVLFYIDWLHSCISNGEAIIW